MKKSPNMYLDPYEQDRAEITDRSSAKQTARELAALAAQSNHPATILPPQPIPTKRPGHRWFSKGPFNAIKDQPIPEHHKKLQSRHLSAGN
jgi:hypothetical protein